MFHTNKYQQPKMEMVIMEELVPENHLLRKIDKFIDFSFIVDIVRPYYCEDNGRPSVDPLVLFKMIFLGYLYGIRSERRLIEEIQTNIAYRWFLGIGLTDKVPHHSTISQNRIRRFKGTNVFQEVFDEIVWQAINHGMVAGRELFSDSTHLKANANKKRFKKGEVVKQARKYLSQLDKAVEEDRREHGKKPLEEKPEEEERKETRISTTDPESGYMVRDGKPEGFFYLDHRTVDGCCNIITDVHVTPGNVHDSVPYLERLDRQMDTFGFDVKAVALDAGYLTNPICFGLRERRIMGVIAHRRFKPTHGLFHKWKFKYNPDSDTYTCPAGETLEYSTTDREGYRPYVSRPETCQHCEMLPSCTRAKNHRKVVTRHVWEDNKDQVRENRLSPYGKLLYQRRKETVERSFADAKELHGLRYCRFRGLEKVKEQCLMAATVQNIKKIARLLWRQHNYFQGMRLAIQ